MARMNDFINRLREEALKEETSDVIYSQPVINTRVIPPDEVTIKQLDIPSIRVIPPQEEERKTKPKFSLKPKQVEIKEEIIEEPIKENEPIKVVEKPIEIKKEPDIEYLFNRSETDISKKEIWVETYLKAQKSVKTNSIAKALKSGRFTITKDSKIEILPEYDIYKKSSSDILNDRWI